MLLVEKPCPGVAVVTLNRPEAMNALSRALRAALRQAMVELDADPQVKVIVLTGAGERAFTAGLDLKELSSDPLGMGAANATDPAYRVSVDGGEPTTAADLIAANTDGDECHLDPDDIARILTLAPGASCVICGGAAPLVTVERA